MHSGLGAENGESACTFGCWVAAGRYDFFVNNMLI